MTHLKNKAAVVTGSTSGIGLCIAQKLADKGVNIVMNGFGDAEQIEVDRKAIEDKGVRCIYHGADMSKRVEIKGLMATAERNFGTIDILVNNAGIQHVAPVEEFPPEKWDAIIAINLSAAFDTVHLAVPMMKKSGWGRIINMASVHALVASPYKSAYVAAKHGLLGFTKSIALELARDGITVNAICPGYVDTPLVRGQIADTAKARGITEKQALNDVILAAQWTKDFINPEHIAEAIMFLCSDAGQNITGTDFTIDGGWSAS